MAFPESTMDWKTTIIFDLDDDRRAAIYRELAPSGSAIPVASLADLEIGRAHV